MNPPALSAASPSTVTGDRPLTVGFMHLDLGISGADRLVLDAALYLQAAGHRVTIFTSHHDPRRAFPETSDDTLEVRVFGRSLPAQVGQRLRAPCAIVRMCYLAGAVLLHGGPCDVIVCDLVSHAIPLLRWLGRVPVVFYCHFPDQRLTPPRHPVYNLYRAPIDRWEATSTGLADRVLVNSAYTAACFRDTFPQLRTVTPEVVYPSIEVADYPCNGVVDDGEIMVLTLSRFVPEKNLVLAIDALAQLRERVAAPLFARLRLIIAGGYNDRVRENRETLRGLQARAQQLHLDDHVTFRCSVTEAERLSLLARCWCVLYPPEHEPFGIVPLEAMAAGRPVIAVDSGGVRESVRHGETGWLCRPTPEAFADALALALSDRDLAVRMGQAGRAHVAQHFSRAVFGTRLEAILREVVAERAERR